MLRVKQRVSDSGARSTAYDYMFGIPSFSQIVNLLHDWNTRELSLVGRPGKTGGVAGMYVELKRSKFFEEDANVSIANVFLDELAHHEKASELLFNRYVTLCDGLKYDEYQVPPLVVQSFDGETLRYLRQMFKQRWQDFVQEDATLVEELLGNDTSTVEEDEINHPWIPPLVLLVDHTTCRGNEFWFDVAKYHVSGIGPDKMCLLPSEQDVDENKHSLIERAKKEAREWIAKAHSEKLAVHPWTVRLEMESQGQSGGVPSMFSSAEEEIRYYYCDLKIDGIFTENIAIAQIVGNEGCDDTQSSSSQTSKWPIVGKGGPVCVEEESNLWFFGLAFLALGTFIGSIATCFVWSCASKGHFARALGTTRQNSQPMPLPEIDTSMEEDDDDEGHDVL